MPEIGPMMRALELQRLIEDKVTEWRERSARVGGVSVADSYQQPLNFKRHTNRCKQSNEINRIIAKYSKTYRTTEKHQHVLQQITDQPPTRPARHKKVFAKLSPSKSEDNIVNVRSMKAHSDPIPESKPMPKYTLNKYNAKSCEDITAFVDFDHTMKSKHFQENNSILNAKTVSKARTKLHSICEDPFDISEFQDSDVELRSKMNFATSTPLSHRRTCPPCDSVSVISFEKCIKYSCSNNGKLRKGSSEPDIFSDKSDIKLDRKTIVTKTLDDKKGWKILKPHFKKGTFDCILRWRGKKPQTTQTK